MEENESRTGKDLALDEKITNEIIEEINVALLNDKNSVILSDGRSFIKIGLMHDEGKNQKGDYKIQVGGKTIATVKNGKPIPSEAIRKALEQYQNRFEFDKYTTLGRIPTEQEKSNPKSIKLEQELNVAKKEGRDMPLRSGREVTTAGEDLSLLMHKMFGERAHEVTRVRDKKDSHQFKYIAKNTSGKYFEPAGSRRNEGTNSTQPCWILNKDGTLEKKPVDDMKVFGKYVLATDIAENPATDDTRTLVGQRTPRGEYVLIPALDYINADTSDNTKIKEGLSRGESVWDIEDVVLAAELGNTIRGTKLDGKLSVEEVEFIKKLKKEGLADERVRRIVNAVLIVGQLKDSDLDDISITAILNKTDTIAKQIEEMKKEGFTVAEIKEVMHEIHEGKTTFEDAKEDILDEKGDKEKVSGEIPEGPWDN